MPDAVCFDSRRLIQTMLSLDSKKRPPVSEVFYDKWLYSSKDMFRVQDMITQINGTAKNVSVINK